MMTRAYNESYLNEARQSLALFFDYLVYDCGFDADWAATLFVASGYAEQFERGNPAVLAGMSGIELARAVVKKTYREPDLPEARYGEGMTDAYWAGWALALYQWHSARRFKDIFACVKASDILAMYAVYHEMDSSKFIEAMEKKCSAVTGDTRLRKLRESRGLSQARLAELSGVKLRSIQMYEQRINDIDKAQVQTVYKLSWVIGCSVEDLLENPAGIA